MNLHLIRMNIRREELIRFAGIHNLLASRDDDFGYALHAWLKAMFGDHAPKPFYYDANRSVLYGYSQSEAKALADHAQAFADPSAYCVLMESTLAGKPMPRTWRIGNRLELHVRACPITRKDDNEKDVYLRALDRWEQEGADPSNKPERIDVYRQWFIKQIDPAIFTLEHLSLTGVRARGFWLRRSRGERPSRLRVVERPEAHFRAVGTIQNEQGLTDMLLRGIGRHRAFGFGMIRVLPAR